MSRVILICANVVAVSTFLLLLVFRGFALDNCRSRVAETGLIGRYWFSGGHYSCEVLYDNRWVNISSYVDIFGEESP